MINEFAALGLRPELLSAIKKQGYVEPTPIQAAVIPIMLSGQDLIGQAQTGTGKTAAFALPMIQNLRPEQTAVQGLIVAPTRELALQVSKAVVDYSQHLNPRILAVYGGQPYEQQIGKLRRGVDIVIGTPGRLLDLMSRNVLDLSQVQTVILDEADEMLSMGFIEDIEAILTATPSTRQTALFSATIPQPVRRLASQYMQQPQTVAIEASQRTVEAIEQRYYLVNSEDKVAALTRLFEVEPLTSTLVFVRTRLETERLTTELKKRGFPAEALSGDLNQPARERVLERFRRQQSTVVVATDVAARGLDIEDISHVINYDLPQDPDTYIHRVGRTGRAGRTGVAITIITPNEEWQLRRIEKYAKTSITRGILPTVEMILAHREDELLEQMKIWLRRGRYKREMALVETMLDEGHDPLQIAAAAVKLARAEEKQRPIAEISPVREKRQSQRGSRRADNHRGRSWNGDSRQNRRANGVRDGGKRRSASNSHHYDDSSMIRLLLNRGKAHGIRPNDVVSTLAHYADIPGSSIGKIIIDTKETLVDVPEQYVSQVLAQSGRYKMRKHAVDVERV